MLKRTTRIGLLAPISWNVPPNGYGPWEKVVADLAQGFTAAGYKVVLFATKQAHIPGVKTRAILNKPFGNRRITGRYSHELIHIAESLKIAEKEVDILHNHLNFRPLLFSKFLSIPMVTTLHGSGSEPESAVAYRHFRRLPYISISNAERNFIPELNYIATIYDPVNFAEFKFNPVPQNYLVNAGRMHPDKGVHHAVRLAKKIGKKLYLAGPVEPQCQEYFKKEITPFIDNRQIFYLGNLSSTRVRKLIGQATAFVGMIDWEEPFGRSVAEAMACGTPIIATPRGSHREIIADGVSGILVSSVHDAAKRFNELLKIDRAACRQHAENLFGLPIITQRHLACYEKILK